MTNGVLYSVAGVMIKHAVDGKIDIAISMCKKILEELENRKGK